MKRVFLVDDQQLVLNAMRRELSRSGCELVTFVSPEEALREAKRNPPDVVVIDLVMEEMDGISLLTRLHQLNPKVRAVVISTGLDLFLVNQASLMGIVHSVLPKPWPSDSLKQAVAALAAGA